MTFMKQIHRFTMEGFSWYNSHRRVCFTEGTIINQQEHAGIFGGLPQLSIVKGKKKI